jgi:hypothetical protein
MLEQSPLIVNALRTGVQANMTINSSLDAIPEQYQNEQPQPEQLTGANSESDEDSASSHGDESDDSQNIEGNTLLHESGYSGNTLLHESEYSGNTLLHESEYSGNTLLHESEYSGNTLLHESGYSGNTLLHELGHSDGTIPVLTNTTEQGNALATVSEPVSEPNEQEDIAQLVSLTGVPSPLAKQVYDSCGRNVGVAAELLFQVLNGEY